MVSVFRYAPVILVLLAVAMLMAAGCMQTATRPKTGTDLPGNLPPAVVSAGLQHTIDAGINGTGIPGMQIEVSTPRWTWNSAAGNASPITGEPARPGMRFLIASVSKTFASVAVQKLAGEGRLSLDEPVAHRLPADLVRRIPNGNAITIRQLLDHTSGIADYDETAINLAEYHDPDVPVPYQAGLDQGIRASPLFPPGTGYTYSNPNYILLTLIVDNASGVPYEDYVTRNILVPAGLNDTFFLTTNHIPGPHMTATVPGENGTIMDFSRLYVLFDRGAGDLVSTTADLNRFHRLLREGRVISNASLTDMEQPAPQSGPAGYGLGYETQVIDPPGITVKGHTGGYPGSFTFWYYLPDQDTYVTWNLNSGGMSMQNLVDIRAAILTPLKNLPVS